MAVAEKNCQVVTDTNTPETFEGGIPLFFNIACGNVYTPYESLFQHTRVTGTIFIQVDSESTCTFTVTIDRAGHAPIVASIAPTDVNRVINLTVDCLQRITFACSGGAGGFCAGNFTLDLHWCKCC